MMLITTKSLKTIFLMNLLEIQNMLIGRKYQFSAKILRENQFFLLKEPCYKLLLV